jgi:hypothetical protein
MRICINIITDKAIRNSCLQSTGEIKRVTMRVNDCIDEVMLFCKKVVKRVNENKRK